MTLVHYDLVLVMGLAFNITGITGTYNQLFIRANVMFLLAVVALFALYIIKSMQPKLCRYTTAISLHIFLPAEIAALLLNG